MEYKFDEGSNDIKYINHVHFKHRHQYKSYKIIDYKIIEPFIIKYFNPSQEINQIINLMQVKYKINYDNICVLFYRGNDNFNNS